MTTPFHLPGLPLALPPHGSSAGVGFSMRTRQWPRAFGKASGEPCVAPVEIRHMFAGLVLCDGRERTRTSLRIAGCAA